MTTTELQAQPLTEQDEQALREEQGGLIERLNTIEAERHDIHKRLTEIRHALVIKPIGKLPPGFTAEMVSG